MELHTQVELVADGGFGSSRNSMVRRKWWTKWNEAVDMVMSIVETEQETHMVELEGY